MPFFKKLTDERLQAKNLLNVRIAFVVQTLGVVAVLAYDLTQHGARHTFSEPLYLVLLVSLTIYVALTIPVARENGEA